VASKSYFLAGSNRKQIVFDRTSTERLVDKINNPLENIFSTPLIVFQSFECETVAQIFIFHHLSLYLSAENQNRTGLRLRTASGRACNSFWTAADSANGSQHFFPHFFPLDFLFGHRDRPTLCYKDVHTSLLFRGFSVSIPISLNTYSASKFER